MIDIKYANAYSEVLEILKYVTLDDYKKIPKEKIDIFNNNANKNYKFNYDINKTLEEQNVSKIAKAIIAILYRDYWATDIQREKILAKQKFERQRIEEEKAQNYQYEDLFKKNRTEKQQTEVKVDVENVSLVEYKESIIIKILNKIKSIFKS